MAQTLCPAAAALVLLLPLAMAPGAGAQDLPERGLVRATVQQILDRPELYIDARLARVKDVASAPEQFTTRNTRAQLRFSSGAAGRVNRFSLLRLDNRCILLEQGQLLVSGRQGSCTASVRVSVRGTNYILEAFENGDAAVTSLEGRLEVVLRRDGASGEQAPIQVESGQRLRLLLGADLTTVIALTPADYRAILEGPLFRGFDQPLPAQGALEDHLRANVPGVSLPRPEPRAERRRAPFSFGFGFGFGGGGPEPGDSRPSYPRGESGQ
ncbi:MULTISPECIES: hypothetical protein [Aphanothece]|uniref:hypothetical protein n=1 Tax=Aphanothece TaxID=1121 RepID=UPI003984F19C